MNHQITKSWRDQLLPSAIAGRALRFSLGLSALVSIAVTIAIVVVLFKEVIPFFEKATISEFLFGREWRPLFEPQAFGVLPILWGSLMVAGGASILAVPIGVGIAVYLSEYADPRTRKFIKPILEVLAGIPSVVYGFFALITITPVVKFLMPEAQFFNALSAIIVVTIMVLPTITSLSEDAISAVPRLQKDGGFGLGATRFEVAIGVVLPAASSGILSSIILAFSRAIGETMAVSLAAGATPNLTINPLESIQTMTAFIVQVCLGDAPHGTTEYYSLFAVAVLLFAITLSLNIFAQLITKNVRRRFSA